MFSQRKMKEVGTRMQGKEKKILMKLSYRHLWSDTLDLNFPILKIIGIMYSAEWPILLLSLWGIVAIWGRGITPKLMSLFSFREMKEIIFSLIPFFPVSFLLEKKNCLVHSVFFLSSQFSSTLRLLWPNSKHPSHLFIFASVVFAVMEVFCNL